MPDARFRENLIGSQWASLDAALLRWGAQHFGHPRKNLLRARLFRFIRWCAEAGQVAEFVDDKTLSQFLLETKQLKTLGGALRRANNLRRAWNRAVCVVPGWPAAWVAPPTKREHLPAIRGDAIVSFAERDFHPALVREVNLYCSKGGFLDPEREALSEMTHQDRMGARLDKIDAALRSGNALPMMGYRPKPLHAESVYRHRRLIFRTATALHLAGVAKIEDLRSIRDVITPKGAAVLADSLRQRSLEATYAVASIAGFSQIAKRCGIIFPFAEDLAFRELMLDVIPHNRNAYELSERNLSRLLRFDDPGVFAMLVALPDAVLGELETRRRRRGGWVTPKAARQARAAVAIEILNTLPLRRTTLLSLDLKRNFDRRRGAPPTLIIFPDQVKKGRALQASLSARTWRLISLYRKHYRPMLAGADRSQALFPGGAAETLSQARIALGISRLVRARLGVTMNMHLWRHLMATKLAEKRERTEDAEKLLGHVPGSRATGRYVRIGAKIAADWLREITDEVRPRGVELLSRRHTSRRESGSSRSARR